MVSLISSCPDCGEPITLDIYYQTPMHLELRWSESYRCLNCHSAMEADGVGFLDESIRQLMLEKEGTWKLVIDIGELNNKVNKIRAFKNLRQSLNLSLKDISILQNTFPNLIVGTKTEMEWLKAILASNNIKSKIQKINQSEDNLIWEITTT